MTNTMLEATALQSPVVEVPALDEETRDVLRRAKEYVSRGWCQHSPACDNVGFAVVPHDVKAVSWCVTGAVERAIFDVHGEARPPEGGWGVGGHRYRIARKIKPVIAALMQTDDEPGWNNAPGRTQAEVVALFDRALLGDTA